MKVIMLVGMFATAIGFLIPAVRVLKMARASRAWRETPAEITWFERQPWGHTSYFRITWGDLVRYDYWVDGVRYEGSRRWFTIWRFGGMTFAKTEEINARYPQRAHVIAYVDPADPRQSTLERRIDWSAVTVCLGFALMALLFGGYYALDLLGVIDASG